MSQLVIAYGAGMLALASPCGFAMLPAFMAYNVAESSGNARNSVQRLPSALAVGLGVGLGFAATFVAGGLLVSAGLRSLTDAVPWFGVVVGFVLVGIGVAMALGRRVSMRLGTGRFAQGSGGGRASTVTFGAAYASTQLACGMGSLLAVTGTGMAASSFAGTAAVFAAFGLGSLSLLLLLAVSTAMMSGVLVQRVRAIAPFVSRISGAVLALAGLYLVTYWSPTLSGGSAADNSASRVVHDISSQTRAWLGSHEGWVAVASVLLVAMAMAGAAWMRARHETERSSLAFDAPREDTRV